VSAATVLWLRNRRRDLEWNLEDSAAAAEIKLSDDELARIDSAARSAPPQATATRT
jgi:hypothetical protein